MACACDEAARLRTGPARLRSLGEVFLRRGVTLPAGASIFPMTPNSCRTPDPAAVWGHLHLRGRPVSPAPDGWMSGRPQLARMPVRRHNRRGEMGSAPVPVSYTHLTLPT